MRRSLARFQRRNLMQRRLPGLWLILGLALHAQVASTALGQQKYRLRDVDAPGDLCVVDSSMDLNLQVAVTAPGQDAQSVPIVTRQRDNYREEVLAVDKKGPSSLRRSYTISRVVTMDPSLQEHKAASPLQGKTVTIQRKGGKVVVTTARGTLPARVRQQLLTALDHSDMDFFPDREVAVGEEWTIDPQLMTQLFPGMSKVETKYQFQEVVQFAGHPCARIRLTVDMTGQPQDVGAPMTAQLSGDLYHALDLKRTVSVELTGPTTVEAQKEHNGMPLQVSGDGTMRIKETRRWLKVHGRSLAVKR